MSLPLTLAGLVTILGALIGVGRGQLESYQADGLISIGNAVFIVSNVMNDSRLLATLNAAACAYSAYRWWKGGGGDDTKRRLRSVWKPFEPVRRTAPQGAS